LKNGEYIYVIRAVVAFFDSVEMKAENMGIS
jgi:hypothetical protein